jgi:hypothetical protein
MKYGQRRGVLKVTFFDKHIRDQDSFKSQEGFFLHLFYGSFFMENEISDPSGVCS